MLLKNLALLVLLLGTSMISETVYGHPHGEHNSGSNDNSGGGSGEGSGGSDGGSSCFPGDALVSTPDGEMQIQDLLESEGVEVQVVDPSSGKLAYSPVRLWLHVSQDPSVYLQIQTEGAQDLHISKTHFIYQVPCDRSTNSDQNPIGHPVFAEKLQQGDCVLIRKNKDLVPEKITKISGVEKQGRYQFTTTTGTVIVNQMVASTYSIIDNNALQHFIFTGLYHVNRMMKSVLPDSVIFNGDLKNSFADMMYFVYHSKMLF